MADHDQQQEEDKNVIGDVSTSTTSSEQQSANNMKRDKPKQETSGRITLKIGNFSTFAQQGNGDVKRSDHVEIQGIQWRIGACINTKENGAKCLGCFVSMNGKAPTCRAFVIQRLLNLKDGANHLEKHEETPDIYSKHTSYGYGYNLLSIKELMDPANGWIDTQTDSITLEADVFADRPLDEAGEPRQDILIVNGHKIEVDKYFLSVHSSYFKSRFFENNGTYNNGESALNIEIDEAVSSVDDFKMMLDCMYSEHPPLNDVCIEGVLNKANAFLVDRVESLCIQYLLEKCKKSSMFKYRLAEKYGLGALKEVALRELAKQQLSGEKLVEYTEELAKMEDGARAEFTVLLAKRVQAPAAKRD